MSVPTRWLSTYVGYQCRHAGACCSSGWPIPIETAPAALVEQAVQTGRIDTGRPWLVQTAEQPEEYAGLLAVESQPHCVFRQQHRCAIQRVIGEAALPSACRHFPRVVLVDPRGVFVTLSHYCPTVVAMLMEDGGPPAIVEGPPALPNGASPEGLDARDAWPPLLRDGVLMEHAAYAAWEAHMVRVLGERAPELALARLERDAERLARWTPGEGALAAVVAALGEACADEPRVGTDAAQMRAERRACFDAVRQTVSPPLQWDAAPGDGESTWRTLVASSWPVFAPNVGRYLAARAFASWVAYQGSGVAAVVGSIRASLAVLEVEIARMCTQAGRPLDQPLFIEAVRRADLLLVHYVDRQRFADLVSC